MSEGKNPSSFYAFQLLVASPGKPVQFQYPVPPGCKLSIMALYSNTGLVFIASSASNVSQPSARILLTPGQPIKLKIDNAKAVYLDAQIANEGVVCLVEQE